MKLVDIFGLNRYDDNMCNVCAYILLTVLDKVNIILLDLSVSRVDIKKQPAHTGVIAKKQFYQSVIENCNRHGSTFDIHSLFSDICIYTCMNILCWSLKYFFGFPFSIRNFLFIFFNTIQRIRTGCRYKY